KERGYSEAEIGTHAGLADTSLALAVDPSLVRGERLRSGAKLAPSDGVHGDPARASAELGNIGVDAIVARTVDAIRRATGRREYHTRGPVHIDIPENTAEMTAVSRRPLRALIHAIAAFAIAGASIAQAPAPAPAVATIPGMPGVTDPANLYSDTTADKMSPA